MDDANSFVSDTAIPALIDGALAEPWHTLAFSPALEARYRADGRLDRLRYQRRVGLVGMGLFVSFLISDASVVPDVFGLSLVLRIACLVAAVPVLALLRPGTPDWLTELLAAWLTLPCIATITALFVLSHSPDRTAYLNGTLTCVVFANICLQQSFRWAAAADVVFLAVVIAGVSASGIAPGVQHFQILLLVATMVLTLMIAHRLEWQMRRFYLFSAQEQLRKAELERSNARLMDLADRDGLTGLANRRALDRHLQKAWSACAVRDQPIAVIMLDVDWFKRFNDTYGHPAGDACLRAIGDAISGEVRDTGDLAGRYGGEEFIVILQGADAATAFSVAERVRVAIESLAICHATSPAAPVVTASLGLACRWPGFGGDISDLIEAADTALYTAKQTGRARVSCAAPMIAGG